MCHLSQKEKTNKLGKRSTCSRGAGGRRERVGVSGVGAALATVEMSGKVPKVARKEGSEGPRGVPQIPAVGPG